MLWGEGQLHNDICPFPGHFGHSWWKMNSNTASEEATETAIAKSPDKSWWLGALAGCLFYWSTVLIHQGCRFLTPFQGTYKQQPMHA